MQINTNETKLLHNLTWKHKSRAVYQKVEMSWSVYAQLYILSNSGPAVDLECKQQHAFRSLLLRNVQLIVEISKELFLSIAQFFR